MIRWTHKLTSYSPEEVQEFCVNDDSWQRFRLSLKGFTTERKLDKLDEWFSNGLLFLKDEAEFRRVDVQTSNYINALRRGGQLDMNCKVQR